MVVSCNSLSNIISGWSSDHPDFFFVGVGRVERVGGVGREGGVKGVVGVVFGWANLPESISSHSTRPTLSTLYYLKIIFFLSYFKKNSYLCTNTQLLWIDITTSLWCHDTPIMRTYYASKRHVSYTI